MFLVGALAMPSYSLVVYLNQKKNVVRANQNKRDSDIRRYAILIRESNFSKVDTLKELDESFLQDAAYQQAREDYELERISRKNMTELQLFESHLKGGRWRTKPNPSDNLVAVFQRCAQAVCLHKNECHQEKTDYPTPVIGYEAFLRNKYADECAPIVEGSITACSQGNIEECENTYALFFNQKRHSPTFGDASTRDFLRENSDLKHLKNEIHNRLCSLKDYKYCYDRALDLNVDEAQVEFIKLCDSNFALGCFAAGVLSWNKDPIERNQFLEKAYRIDNKLGEIIATTAAIQIDAEVYRTYGH